MARITGKDGKVLAVSSSTDIIVATAMTDGGSHTLFTLTGKAYWDSSKPPTLLVNGVAPTIAYTVNYIAGSVTFASPVASPYTVTVNNITWATLAEVGDLFAWTVDAKLDIVDATAFQDVWHTKLSTFKGWTGSVEGYHVNGYWYSAFDGAKTFYVALYPVASSNERFVGNAYIDWSGKVQKDAVVTSTIKLEGTGELQRLTT